MGRRLWHEKLKRLDLPAPGKESNPMHGKMAGFILMLACGAPGWVQAAPDAGEVKAKIARKIWQNECAGTVKGLVSWNRGEAFPSLGIGHFIWFPAGITEMFEESFPSFVQFCRKRGARVPEWFSGAAPWRTRAEFEAADVRGGLPERMRQWLSSRRLCKCRRISLLPGPWLPWGASRASPAVRRKWRPLQCRGDGAQRHVCP